MVHYCSHCKKYTRHRLAQLGHKAEGTLHCLTCRHHRKVSGAGFFDAIKTIGSALKPFASAALPMVSGMVGSRFGPGAANLLGAAGRIAGLGTRRRRATHARRRGRSFMPA